MVFKRAAEAELSTRERLSRERRHLRTETLADGTTKLELQGRLHHAAVVRVTESGKLERGCVDTPEAMDHWIGSGRSEASPDE